MILLQGRLEGGRLILNQEMMVRVHPLQPLWEIPPA